MSLSSSSSSFRDWVSARKSVWRQRWKVYELPTNNDDDDEDVSDPEDDAPCRIQYDFWSRQGFAGFEDWQRCRIMTWKQSYSWNQPHWKRHQQQRLLEAPNWYYPQHPTLQYSTTTTHANVEGTIPSERLLQIQSSGYVTPSPRRWRLHERNHAFLRDMDEDASSIRTIPYDFWSSQGFQSFQDWQRVRTTQWRRQYSWTVRKRKRIELEAEEIVQFPTTMSGANDETLADWLRVRKNQWKILRRKHQRKLEQTRKDTSIHSDTTTHSELGNVQSPRDGIEPRPAVSSSPSTRRQTSGDMLLIDSFLEEQERKRIENLRTFDLRFLFDASLGAPDDVIALCLRFLHVSEHGKLLCISSTTSKAMKQRDDMWRQLCPSTWILPRRPRKRWYDLYLTRMRQEADASRKLSDDLLALIANVLFKGDHFQKVEKLVADGEKKFSFDVNYVSGVVCERNSILNLAVIHGRQKVARWLVESKGADIESSDRGGFTPLLNAAWAGNIKLVRFLMSKGADRMKLGRGHYSKPLAAPDFKGHTAEGWAREKDYPDVAELLRVGL